MATTRLPPQPPPLLIKRRNSLPGLGKLLFAEAHGDDNNVVETIEPNSNPLIPLAIDEVSQDGDNNSSPSGPHWKSAWKKLHKEISHIKVKSDVVEEFQSAAAKAKKAVQLKNVALELLETEVKYHEKLSSLVFNWQGPLARWSQEQRSLFEGDEMAETAKKEAKNSLSKKAPPRRLRRTNSEPLEFAETGGGGGGGGSSPPRPAQVPDSAITEAEVRLLFGNADELLSISDRILKCLEAVIIKGCSQNVLDGSVLVAIGECFSNIEAELHSYGSYLSTAETATNLLDKVQRRLVVKIFMDSCRHQVASLKGTSLSSLLIEPVQRLPRYQLLLRELIKYSPPGKGRDALSKGLTAVEAVCADINKEMADADMYKKLSKLSKIWGVDILTRPNINAVENQCLLCGGGLFENHALKSDLDYLPVLFVRGAKTKQKAEPIMYKALLTRDMLVLGNMKVVKPARRFSFGPNNDMTQTIAAAKAEASEDVFGGGGGQESEDTKEKKKLKASAAIKLSNKCLLVRGYNVIASFKPDRASPSTSFSDSTSTSGFIIHNMLHLDSECSRIIKTSGIRAEDLTRTNQNPKSCFLLLTEGLSFAIYPPSDRSYSLKALDMWYEFMSQAIGDQQMEGL